MIRKLLAAYLTFSLTHKRPTGVAVACIHAAFLETGADHVLGDIGVVLLAAAFLIGYDGYLSVLQELWLVALAGFKKNGVISLIFSKKRVHS